MFMTVLTVLGTAYVNINNICTIEKAGNGTRIKTNDGKELLTKEEFDVTISRLKRIID
ncbi:hypothetical protein [Chryseobacterium sp. SN22]|uniref:hypothetical protein n=1 Tax=Chryseobacterium sp. SN22 TaxID=2606431 RepID=UPI001E625506|nr:hypothetical protein [Chryseobacterium sp. SN22]